MSTKNSFSQEFIMVKGAKMHNLKNVDVQIPKKKLIVITGVSGSGKSSLAFDTLFAEGQRRYIESLSSYARQFLGKLQKPDVETISGLSPAIAIKQKVNTQNPRSTVGTATEIYDYLKLLYSRIGKTISPISNKEVKKHQVGDVVDFFCSKDDDLKVMVLTELSIDDSVKESLQKVALKGFSRVKINDSVFKVNELLDTPLEYYPKKDIWIIIDRLKTDKDSENLTRLADSVETAFSEGNGKCVLDFGNNDLVHFSNLFELDDMLFYEPTEKLFSFNNPYGACSTCEGFGTVLGIDEKKVIPNMTLSVFEGAVSCWKGNKLSRWKERFILKASEYDFPIHRAYMDLSEEEKKLLWNGANKLKGIRHFFKLLEKESYKVQNRVLLARYRGKTTCHECQGSRLKKEAFYVQVDKKTIDELVNLPLNNLLSHFKHLHLSKEDVQLSERILKEITERLLFLNQVGLGYLTLNRLSSTLSGGESQRINLATSLASSLVGSMYVLDEPSIGLHSRDTKKLIEVLKSLRDIGNTVIVVEHDEEIMLEADEIIDIGPLAGKHGGEIVFQGDLNLLKTKSQSITSQYLTQNKAIEIPSFRRKSSQSISIKGAREHNLKNIDVKFPLESLTVVSGVSGSGKSTLVQNILFPAVQKSILGYSSKIGAHEALQGDLNVIKHIEFINQNPIGRSSRSNPVTYLKAFDDIRTLLARQELAKVRNFKSGHFSFNIPGGRCDHCEGEGEINIEMQFMADIKIKCEECQGQRFKKDILAIKFANKNIAHILEMTVDEAIDFFDSNNQAKIVDKLRPLANVGLGYIQLGQSSNTLSGGEAQRVKLAYFLSKGTKTEKSLFIFDEPTTGLHFHDIDKLLHSFNALIEIGHTIVCVEHNHDVIKCADWVIDLGPEGGEHGGQLIFQGTPEELVKVKESHTAPFLHQKLLSRV